MAENFNVFDFELSPEDMKPIETLDQKESSSLTIGIPIW
jgi:diketogulonate reductase-like aldo/keto reductase